MRRRSTDGVARKRPSARVESGVMARIGAPVWRPGPRDRHSRVLVGDVGLASLLR
jgi:hypothetical protein